MAPQVATFLCLVGIVYLFRVDRYSNRDVSGAIWIPLIWMFFAGSRFASQWLNLSPAEMSAQGYSEGSPLDRNVFLVLIIAGIWVLRQRRLNWAELFNRNAWICLYFLFAAISVLWADDSFLSFKRWIKGLGNLVMALIIITERRPDEALGFVLRRLGFVLLPLSVLFIKFYPELGRGYHMGMPMFNGAALTKNALGQLCLITGIYYFWELLLRRNKPEVGKHQLHYSAYLIILPTIAWLLYMANSATSLACLVIAVALLVAARWPPVSRRPRRIYALALTSVIILALLESLFGIKETIILMLGRRPDLTDRDEIWQLALSMASNPLIGSGYESFWTGGRLLELWRRLGVEGLNQSHNGYIEVYLNLGIIGLFLLLGGVVAGLVKVRGTLETEYAYAMLKFALLVAALTYNYTEAMFVSVSNIFVLLLIAILENGRTKKNNEMTMATGFHARSSEVKMRQRDRWDNHGNTGAL